MSSQPDCQAPDERFASVFAHLGAVAAYARRRGADDPEAIAAEAMTIALERLADVPRDDPRPWLYATARNIVRAEYRRRLPTSGNRVEREAAQPTSATEIDPLIAAALAALSPLDREALLLVAWEDLPPRRRNRSASTRGGDPRAGAGAQS